MADITGWRSGQLAGRKDFQRVPTGGIEAGLLPKILEVFT